MANLFCWLCQYIWITVAGTAGTGRQDGSHGESRRAKPRACMQEEYKRSMGCRKAPCGAPCRQNEKKRGEACRRKSDPDPLNLCQEGLVAVCLVQVLAAFLTLPVAFSQFSNHHIDTSNASYNAGSYLSFLVFVT